MNNIARDVNTTLYRTACFVYERSCEQKKHYPLRSQPQIDNEAARREYLKRTSIFAATFVGFVPVTLLFVTVGHWIGFPALPVIVAIVLMGAFVVAGFWRTTWKCPRCHHMFFWRWWRGDTFAWKCVHCRYNPFGDQK